MKSERVLPFPSLLPPICLNCPSLPIYLNLEVLGNYEPPLRSIRGYDQRKLMSVIHHDGG